MSHTHQKDKRTKEQLLQILSNALTQEEQMGEKIKMLENQLAACQKQQEGAQVEINSYGLSASKESFRIDYYKASENGRLKGIIEHLPSRQKKSFQGLDIKNICLFMERFLPEAAKQQKAVVTSLKPTREHSPVSPENPGITVREEPLLTRPEREEMALADLARDQGEAEAVKIITPLPLPDQQPENAATENRPLTFVERLRAQLQSELLNMTDWPMDVVQAPDTALPPYRSPLVERMLTKTAATQSVETISQLSQVEEATAWSTSDNRSLLERLRG